MHCLRWGDAPRVGEPPRTVLCPDAPRYGPGARRPAVTALYFLALAVVIVVVGGLVLWAMNRQPSSTESSISAFKREMDALSPKDETDSDRGSRRAGRR